jgi:hypothetical protein
MPSFEEIRQRIKRNFPNQAQSDAKRQKLLEWNRETANTITSACGRYRIVKHSDGAQTFEYSVWSIASTTQAPKKITGPFVTPKEAREAAQDHANGMPMQADLSPTKGES